MEDISRPRVVYEALEHSPVDIPIKDLMDKGRLDLYNDIIGKNYFRIYLKGDALVFQAGGYVGLIPVNDRVAIDVKPRIEVSKLERILALSGFFPITLSPHKRLYEVGDTNLPCLLDIFATSLINAVTEIENFGKIGTYIREEKSTSFPSGRILMNSSFTKHISKGYDQLVDISRFERRRDNPINRCIKYAIKQIAGQYSVIAPRKGHKRIVSELNRIYNFFDDISIDHAKSFLNDSWVVDPIRIPSLRSYYFNAVTISKSILLQKGITLPGAKQEMMMASLVINMEEIFEAYLRSILRREQAKQPGLSILDGNVVRPIGGGKALFDSSEEKDMGKSVEAKPDIIVSLNNPSEKEKLLIIDAKYKPVQGMADRHDVNQILAYAASYRCKKLILAVPRAKGAPRGISRIGFIESTHLYQYFFDLASQDIESEEKAFVEKVIELISKK